MVYNARDDDFRYYRIRKFVTATLRNNFASIATTSTISTHHEVSHRQAGKFKLEQVDDLTIFIQLLQIVLEPQAITNIAFVISHFLEMSQDWNLEIVLLLPRRSCQRP